MDQWEQGFFKLPEFHLLDEEPSPNHSTSGMIHGNKFRKIFEGILEDDMFVIDEVLRGHMIHSRLSKLKPNQLADFCRHVIYLNRDQIGWQKADELIDQLDRKYHPSWKLPDFMFNDDFKELYSSIVRWELSAAQKQYLRTFISNSNYLEKSDFETKFSSTYAFWNFRELSEIFHELLIEVNTVEEVPEIAQTILSLIESIFLDQIKEAKQPLKKRIALLSNLLQIYASSDIKSGTNLQNLLDRIWTKVETSLEEREIISYRYLFGINYAFIAHLLFQEGLEFLDRRRLINKVVASFNENQAMSIDEWLDFVLHSNLDNRVVKFIIVGFDHIASILFEFLKEIPPGDERKELLKLHRRITLRLKAIISSYFDTMLNLNLNEGKDFFSLLGNLSKLPISKRGTEQLMRVFIFTFQTVALLGENQNQIHEQYISLANEYLPPSEGILYEFTIRNITGTYPFEQLFQKIKAEAEEAHTLVISTTFEKEIIKKISIIMDRLLKEVKSGKIVTYEFQQLFYFISEWLNFFSGKNILYQDAMMILSPIISICFIQISQGYYLQNMSERAFLNYIDMHLFLIMIKNQMEVVGKALPMPRKQVASEFKSMISEWDLGDMLSRNEIKHKITDMELSFQSSSFSFTGLIEDDIMTGFLDSTDKLEELLGLMHDQDSIGPETIVDLYQPPLPNSLNIIERIGANSINNGKTPLPFPILRNIDMVGSALSIIPVQLALPESAKDSLIAGVEEFIMK